jgi:hypothetical protein
MASYRYEATSVEGFVQQLAVGYVAHGYWFYVTGFVPDGKDVRAVDEKLIARYGVAVSRTERARRKRAGLANVHYLRLERFFVLLATHGQHRFFEEEADVVRDIRHVPLKHRGYSVSYRGGHPSVRIEREEFKRRRAFFLELACHRSAPALAAHFGRVPFEPYAPVRTQLFIILRAVNRARNTAGFEPVPWTSLRLRRRVVRPFELVWAAP